MNGLLSFPWGVEGYLHPNEGRVLFEYAGATPEGSAVVELGAYKGRSTICLAQSGRRVVSVDHWAGEPSLPKAPGVYQDHRDGFYRRQYEENLQAKLGDDWASRVFPYTGDTGDVELARAISVAHGPIGLVFIDADHSPTAVQRDFAAWAPHVPVGGYLLFHDQHWRGPAYVIGKAVESGMWASRHLVRDVRVLERIAAASAASSKTKVGVA